MKFILVKASDVPTYVEYGAADIGIVGKDTLLEESRNLYEMVDLGFGKCKMAVCGPKELKGKLDTMTNLRVASKYPHIAIHIILTASALVILLFGRISDLSAIILKLYKSLMILSVKSFARAAEFDVIAVAAMSNVAKLVFALIFLSSFLNLILKYYK